MVKSTEIVKAKRATITLGDIELDVFQLPDGSYKWSAKHITEAINIRHSRVAQISASKQARNLIGTCFEVADFKPNKIKCSDSGNITGYSTEVAFFVWQYEAIKGNEIAQSLVFSSGVEVLERRADAAFNILRTEEERNDRFIARKDSILQRHFWTDAVKWYLDNHPELSDSYQKFIYPNVSNCLNRGFFGKTAKEIREMLDMDASENVRDCVNPSFLLDFVFVEKYAALQVKKGLEPLQAIKEALVFCSFPIRCPKTALPVLIGDEN